MSFSLAFSPNLITALENVLGAKSQSIFVEEWLRQHPQIAAELTPMNNPEFIPPVARYTKLMERLLVFYSPGESTRAIGHRQEATIPQILLVAQKAIILHQKIPEEDFQLDKRGICSVCLN